MLCCPLQECDEYAKVFERTYPHARKEHECYECGKKIVKGEKHSRIGMFFDGAWSSWRECLLCEEIGDHFSCGGGRVSGTLWEDLEQNFFPDMAMGGPCMQGLSPAAKLMLVEKRMEWYFAQDEIDDNAWDFWPKYRDRQKPVRVVVEREPEVHWSETPEYYWKRELELDAYRQEIAEEKSREEDP